MKNYKVSYTPESSVVEQSWRTVSAETAEAAALQFAEYSNLNAARLIPLTANLFACGKAKIFVEAVQ